MGRPGPAADPRSANRHPTAAWTDVPNVPFDYVAAGHQLPAGRDWHPDVVTWFDVVASMPHAVTWSPGDWLAVGDLAAIKQTYYQGAAPTGLVAEMRQRENDLGVTTEARNKLRIRYVAPADDTAAPPATTDERAADGPADPTGSVTPIASARDRLRRASA